MLFAFLVFGCAVQPNQIEMPSGFSEKTATPTLDGFSIRQTERVATVIAIKTASQTPFPIAEGEILFTPFTHTATPSLLGTSEPCLSEFLGQYTKISPNGKWLAESCTTNGTMKISSQDESKSFIINSKDYFNDPLFPELTGSVEPVHWTKDSRFIYFTVTPEQWNEGAYHLDSFAPLLCRLDIVSGEISEVLFGAFYHSFSPTDRRLIEIQEFERPVKLIVHDLKTGLSQTLIPDINSKNRQAARVVWSPDGLKFGFVAAFGGEYGDEVNEPNIQSLILVDLNDLSQRMVISEIPDFIEPVSWDENDIIVYKVMNYLDQITTYAYNYQSEEIIVLPTNTP